MDEAYSIDSIVKCGCGNCGETRNLLACSRCKNRWYCSKEHQKQDWKTHKKACAVKNSPNTAAPTTASTGGGSQKSGDDNPLEQRYKWNEMPTELIKSVYRQGFNLKQSYGLLHKMITSLVEAITQDIYPSKEIEAIVGIEMPPRTTDLDANGKVPIGRLVYLAWVMIIGRRPSLRDKYAIVPEVVLTILLGEFPEWFQLEVMENLSAIINQQDYPVSPCNSAVPDIVSRFDEITYDTLLLTFKYGPMSEADLTQLGLAEPA